MILQSLHAYYERRQKLDDPARRLPPVGLVEQAIGYLIEIERDGRFVQLLRTGEIEGGKLRATRFLVPQGVKRASGVSANLLWDNVGYALGVGERGDPERIRKQHAAFVARINALPESATSDAGVRAVLTFLADASESLRLRDSPLWDELIAANSVVTFRLRDDENGALVCQRPNVIATQISDDSPPDDDEPAVCLVTGKRESIAVLHPAIKGVWGAQPTGGNIVSFNQDSFVSYGKSQGHNAPIGVTASLIYTSTLNALLARDSKNRIQVGDASTVFWSELDNDPVEAEFSNLFSEAKKSDDPDEDVSKVEALLHAIHSGRYQDDAAGRCFHVLALAPNSARIAIRDYQCVPLGELAKRIVEHFSDLAVVRAPHDPQRLSLFRLLCAVAVQGKADNIPPLLGGEVLRSVLCGLNYPRTLLNAAIVRCRAERKVTYARAAILKAWFNRDIRHRQTDDKEFNEMLDTSNFNPAYRLGRLFAALERIQEDVHPGINATIRDRYYGSASSTPAAVFSGLLRLAQHHLSKLKHRPGLKVHRERLLDEIVQGLSDFPAHLALADQGRFALGYYHQRQHFFTKANPESAKTDIEVEETE